MLSESTAERLIAHALAQGADFAEVYVERTKNRNLRLLDLEVQEATSGIERGAGIRLFFGTQVVYAYTNDLSEANLLEVTDTLARLKGGGGRVDARGAGGLDFRKTAPAGRHAPERPFEARDKRWRIERLAEADAAARVGPEIKKVQIYLLERDQEILVVNSEGVWNTDRRVRTRYMVTAIAENEQGMQTGFAGPGLSVGLELFDLEPPAEHGRAAGEQARTLLGARPAPAGPMPVVIGNAFGGVIFHEALGHLLETTSVARKTSVLTDKLGEQIASNAVTYVDDGTLPHAWGSSEYDDEGAPTERTVLIEKGVLKSYMVDRWGSLMTGYRPTGSGRRQDYTFAPTSRMRNTFIEAGDASIESLFEGIEFGLYAKKMGGGQVKPGSGEYNFAVQEGYVIRNGRVEEPVKGAMLVGKGPESIQRIVAVAADRKNAPGMCGSLSGSIPVEVGQPHLLISEIVVGGEG
ncbi:microcin-processing peptidase 2 [Oceanithermus profundus DSM 14977]|uniref:Microcin-processing peptidase 2 n=1 Tax=Oceanithermus profundus (strain DSM 14977 / NBRC 100410 / VKM B-2274 / 506) TaxID=670487 RepID=E4U980_OCEP5|nr:TldD/PmbA family protein [Oceanithermus profundus]ADR36909.1 microcin-processing peptidase 2 [Oceanithermus profundus DSM 14977]